MLSALLSSFMFLNSCANEGPIGPPGPQGPEGPVGAPGESGYVFEYENINFTAGDGYSVPLDFPLDFEGLDSDVALVYLLWDIQGELEVWRPLPMDIFLDGGSLQYNFDYTKLYVMLYMDGTVDLNTLDAGYTDEWVARVVIVPGEFWNSGKIDFSDYYAVKAALGLPDLKKHKAMTRHK